MKYLLTEGLFWGIGYFYISLMKKVLKFFCPEDSRNSVLHIVWGSRALLPYTCVWIYGWYKENLQQESFCKSVLLRSINPRLALLSSSLLLRPSISLSLKTAMEGWSLVCHRCCLLLLLLLCFQPLSRPSTAFFIHFMLTFFFFCPLLSKIIHFYFSAPFVWPDSRIIVGRVSSGMSTMLVYLPTAILPAASLFLFHCDRLAKEKRYTCCLAGRLSAVFVINMDLSFSQVLLLFFLLLPACLDTSGCAV